MQKLDLVLSVSEGRNIHNVLSTSFWLDGANSDVHKGTFELLGKLTLDFLMP